MTNPPKVIAYYATPEQLESFLNAAIREKSGEPVAFRTFDGVSFKYITSNGDGNQDGTPLYLAANPDVIAYIKELRNSISELMDAYGYVSFTDDAEKLECSDYATAKRLIDCIPDSIKPLLEDR
jgi:hypothetical protein